MATICRGMARRRARYRATTNEFWDSLGASDAYSYFVETDRGEDTDLPLVYLEIYLSHYIDDAHAADFVASAPELWVESLATNTQLHDVQIVQDAAQFGDDSAFVAFTRDWDWGATSGYRIYVRLGNRVAMVHVDGDPAISLTEAEQIAAAQLACLEDGACGEPLTVPGFIPAPLATNQGDPTSRTSSRDG